MPKNIETAREGNAWSFGLTPAQFSPEVRT
jgi:hypothetical protein